MEASQPDIYNEVHARETLSICVFILCLGILFILIKHDYKEIFEYCYLYKAYTNNTTFFLKDENSIFHLSEKFKLFSDFSGLKLNTTKCEIPGIGVLKGVQAAVYDMKCIDLSNEAIKILGVYFSYNQKIKDIIYNIISNIQGVLNLWRMRNLTLERRKVVFKTLAISKIVFLALLTKFPSKWSKN